MSLIEKFVFKGKNDGLHLLILGGVHGNETAGIKACQKIISELNSQKIKLEKGVLTLVPICNPLAFQNDVRSMDENLNRVMKIHQNPQSYEQRLANEICPLIFQNRMLLDLHSTHCQGDVPFAFCDYADEYNTPLLNALDVDYVLEGWPEMYAAQDEISDFSTEGYAHFCGNSGTTLECGYHKEPMAENIAYNAVISALKVYGMISGNVIAKPQKTHIKMQNYVIKKQAGKLCRNYKHLDAVSAGENIAVYDTGKILYAPADGYILLPNHSAGIGAEWYYFGTKKQGL
ncbi:MAG: succinylglutamate desuccinylase/aspartoacylase family protein [Alphaproteobacteria bacterium]|nr:succinylglutamate desuccinylase/aspartoacylase family protein [Alphaproteobacteria bacterium]